MPDTVAIFWGYSSEQNTLKNPCPYFQTMLRLKMHRGEGRDLLTGPIVRLFGKVLEKVRHGDILLKSIPGNSKNTCKGVEAGTLNYFSK